MRMQPAEFFTREPCTVTIDQDGIATFQLHTGEIEFQLTMPFKILLRNVAACHDAIAKWQQHSGADILSFYRDAEIIRGERM